MQKLTFRLKGQALANQDPRGPAEVSAREMIQVAGGDPQPPGVLPGLMVLSEMSLDQLAQAERGGILPDGRAGFRGVDAGQVDERFIQRGAKR